MTAKNPDLAFEAKRQAMQYMTKLLELLGRTTAGPIRDFGDGAEHPFNQRFTLERFTPEEPNPRTKDSVDSALIGHYADMDWNIINRQRWATRVFYSGEHLKELSSIGIAESDIPNFLLRCQTGETAAGLEAFSGKWRIIASPVTCFIANNGQPYVATEQFHQGVMPPEVWVFSMPAPNLGCPERLDRHDAGDTVFLRPYKHQFVFEQEDFERCLEQQFELLFATMLKAGIDTPILPAFGGGVFSLRLGERKKETNRDLGEYLYNQTVAKALKAAWQKYQTTFTSQGGNLVLAFPSNGQPHDNHAIYKEIFAEVSSVQIVANCMLDEAVKLKSSGKNPGVLNCGDSLVNGMWWENGPSNATDESLAQRTSMLLCQHPAYNPILTKPDSLIEVVTAAPDSPEATPIFSYIGCKTRGMRGDLPEDQRYPTPADATYAAWLRSKYQDVTLAITGSDYAMTTAPRRP